MQRLDLNILSSHSTPSLVLICSDESGDLFTDSSTIPSLDPALQDYAMQAMLLQQQKEQRSLVAMHQHDRRERLSSSNFHTDTSQAMAQDLQSSQSANVNAETVPKKDRPCSMAKQAGCNELFATSLDVVRYARGDTRKKNMLCPECNTAFAFKDSMESHRFSHHRVGVRPKVGQDVSPRLRWISKEFQEKMTRDGLQRGNGI